MKAATAASGLTNKARESFTSGFSVMYGFDKSYAEGLGRVANSILYWSPKYKKFLHRRLLSHNIQNARNAETETLSPSEYGEIAGFMNAIKKSKLSIDSIDNDLIAKIYQRFYSSEQKAVALDLVQNLNDLHKKLLGKFGEEGETLKKEETFSLICDVVQEVIDETKASGSSNCKGEVSIDDFNAKITAKLEQKADDLMASLKGTKAHDVARGILKEEFVWAFGLFIHEALLEVVLMTTGVNLGGLDLAGLGAVQLYFGIAFFAAAMPYIIGFMDGLWTHRVEKAESMGQCLSAAHQQGKANWDDTVNDLNSWHPVVDGLLGSFFGFGPWVLAYGLTCTSHKVFYTLMALGFTVKKDLESRFTSFSPKEYAFKMGTGYIQGIIKDVQKIPGLTGFTNMAHDARITFVACVAVGLLRLFLSPPKTTLRSMLPA